MAVLLEFLILFILLNLPERYRHWLLIRHCLYAERCATLGWMKRIILILFVIITAKATAQDAKAYDSIEVRVHNRGKHYLREFIVIVDGKEYKFEHIWKNKYSEYITIPYLWPSNKTKTTIIIKRVIKYDEWVTALSIPIDHIGEKKFIQGKYTIEVDPVKRGKDLKVTEKVKKEE